MDRPGKSADTSRNGEPLLYNSRITNTYLKLLRRRYPHVNIGDLLSHAGMEPQQVADEGHWFTQRQVNLFHEKLQELTGNPRIAREAGLFSASPEALGGIGRVILGLVSPERAYALSREYTMKFTRSTTIDYHKVGPTSVEIVITPREGMHEERFQCENRKGYMESIARLFNYDLPRIEHPECVFEGGRCCRYRITWKPSLAHLGRRVRLVAVPLLAAALGGSAAGLLPLDLVRVVELGTGFLALLTVAITLLDNRDLKASVTSLEASSDELVDQIDLNYRNALLITEVGQTLAKRSTIDDILAGIVDTLERRLDFDRGIILLANPEKTRLTVRAGYGYSREMIAKSESEGGFRLDRPESRGVFAVCFREQRPLLVNDIDNIAGELSRRSFEFARAIGVKSFICCPIVYEGEALGVLAVDNSSSKRPLLQRDVNLLMGIAPQLGICIRNVRKEAHIRLLLSSTAEGIYGVDTAGVCTFSNPACLRMLGYGREEELLGNNVHQVIHHSRADGTPYPEEECRSRAAFRERQEVHVDDEVFWRKDGSRFPVEYWSYPVVDEGVVTGAVVAFFDITERRRSEKFIRDILETVDEGFMIVDRNRGIVLANRALGVLVGAPLERIIGRTCHEIFHQLPQPCAEDAQPCQVREVFATGKPSVGEHTHQRVGSGEVKVSIHAYPVFDSAGEVVSAIMTLTDITEKSVLEHQLRQAQKMEAVGRLAGGIAHDFNNMLMAIIGYATLGRELAEAGSKLRHYNDQVLVAADKAADLTRQILAFSRKQVMLPAPIGLNGVIRGLGKIIARLLGEDIEITFNLSDTELVALADRAQIEQVLMNLCTNARDAMPGGGRLVIGTQAILCDHDTVELHGLETMGHHAVITVSDNGAGMDERTRERIFEPFYTTKELGKGTGLGLSIVYGIVKQHHGQINVYSEPGQGTTFRIYLPLTKDAVVELSATTPAAVRGGTETVLLAEDNAEVRALARSVLEEAGYRVVEARDGEEAVRLFTENQDTVRLCLFDVVMPHMSGKDALEAIRARHPGARAIFMSGYAADIMTDRKGVGPGVAILSKPLLPRELLRQVRESLDA